MTETQPLADQPHVVYRLYDADGNLLYVGMTANLDARLNEHRMDKMWWSTVSRHTSEAFPSRTEAAAAEKAAIGSSRPKHNIQLAGKPERPRLTTEEVLTEVLGNWRSGDHETDLFEGLREIWWRHNNQDKVTGLIIRAMFDDGMSVREVARQTGIAKSSVVRWSKLPPPPPFLQRPAGGLSGT